MYERVKHFYESVKTEKKIIGKSAFGRNIYAIKMGEGNPVGIAQYAIHGREYITATLALRHFEMGCRGSVWLVPLVNPDGALLAEVGLSSVSGKEDRKKLLSWNNGSEDFSLWKANGRGVDLNVNFPARWGKGGKNTRVEGSENYIGKAPFCESETLALKRFTERVNPDYTVSYHTKGEEIYWYFYQPIGVCARDKRLATILSKSTGYPLAYARNSAGGYKDWCIQRFGIPAFTVEVGNERFSHPLREEAIADIFEKNERSLDCLSRGFVR